MLRNSQPVQKAFSKEHGFSLAKTWALSLGRGARWLWPVWGFRIHHGYVAVKSGLENQACLRKKDKAKQALRAKPLVLNLKHPANRFFVIRNINRPIVVTLLQAL